MSGMTYDQAVAWLRVEIDSDKDLDRYGSARALEQVLTVLEREHEEADRYREAMSEHTDTFEDLILELEACAISLADEPHNKYMVTSRDEARAALLAYHERVAQERDLHVALSESLKMALRMPGTGNYVEWARECRDAIDALAERDARIAELQKWAQDMVELQASGGRLDGYRELGAKVAEREERIDVLRAELLERDARIAELTAENMCDACAGTGKPISGLDCMCGGTGKASRAVNYLRERLVVADARIAELEPEAERHRWARLHASWETEMYRSTLTPEQYDAGIDREIRDDAARKGVSDE